MFFLTGIAVAQIDRVRFDRIGQRQGLEQLRIYSIIQDNDGFIWFGTQDGLVKFDGYEFRKFTFDPGDANSLSDNFINNLAIGLDGKIWIGTEAGTLDAFDPRTETFSHFSLSGGAIAGGAIEHVYVDSAGDVYVSCRGGGLFLKRTENQMFAPVLNDPDNDVDLQAATVLQFLIRASGDILISIKDLGPAHYSAADGSYSLFERYDFDQYGDAVLCELTDGNLAIGTWGAGLFVDRGEGLRRVSISDSQSDLQPAYIKKILQDGQGKLWIATAQSGIWYYDIGSGESHRYSHDQADPFSLTSNDIETLFEDRSETLWVGTLNGVSKYSRFKYKFNIQRLAHRDARVLSIHEDQGGDLWIGTYLYGLAHVGANSGRERYVNIVDTPPSVRNTVYSLELDGSGGLLLGSADQGVFLLAQGQARPRQASVPMHVADILLDGYNRTWLATSVNGLCRFHEEDGRIESWSFDVIPQYRDRLFDAVALLEDSNRYLWIGTDGGGVLRLHPDRRQYDHFHRRSDLQMGISDDRILCFAEDQQGNIWIGTQKGLNCFHPAEGTFSQYYVRNGLANDTILALLIDTTGNLWASTNNGITRIELPSREFRIFGKDEGLEGIDFNTRSSEISSRGELLFGANGEIVRFHPANLEDNPHMPPIAITSFTVLDQTRLQGRDFDTLDEVSLSYDQNYFSFEFAALDFAETSANRYAYMLEGADKDWVHAGNRRSASYIQVPPGDYTFRVKATNNDGLWSEKEVAVRLKILPPFWVTNEFRFAVVVLLVAAVFTAYKIRTASIRRQRNLLQREVDERKIAEKKLLANRARLRSLANQLTLAEEKERRRISVALHEKIGHALLLAKVKMRDQLERATQDEDEKSIQETIELLEETIRHTRTMTVEISPPSLHQFGIEAAAESLLERFGREYDIRTVINAEGQRKIPFDTAILLYQALSELLVNVFKHAEADLVKVNISDDGTDVFVSVKDNGKGFDVEQTLDSEVGISGYGLFSIQERLEAIHGRLTIVSDVGAGTEVIMAAPMHEAQTEGEQA